MAQRYRYNELAPEGMAALRSLEHYLNTATALPAILLELVRLRCSLLNGCGFCVGLHTAELRKHNEPEERIAAVRDWPASDAYTPRERAALAWADSLTNIQQSHASALDYAGVTAFFLDKDLSDLSLAICSINAWNRLAISSALEWQPRAGSPAPSVEAAPTAASPETVHSAAAEASDTVDAVGDDGAKVAQD